MESKAQAGHFAQQLGLKAGMVVQELGWDDDCDEVLRAALAAELKGELLEETEADADAVLLWQRSDSDVADGLVDAQRDLLPHGVIWLLTPKHGQAGYVVPADIQEGAEIAGMTTGISVGVSPTWNAIKVIRSGGARR